MIINAQIGALALTTIILLWAAYTDVRMRLIYNAAPLTLVAVFAFYAALSVLGAPYIDKTVLMTLIGAPVITGIIVFIGGAILFSLGVFGGGDVKLFAALSLFAGPKMITPILLIMALTGGVVALATLVHHRIIVSNNTATSHQPRVPYGVAIMVAGVWLCMQLAIKISAN